ncbi:MAG: hypothetical protein QOH80_1299 [Actinomycetota bacterium]|nr:hypothetical protein [Actinomycetota bacterium]
MSTHAPAYTVVSFHAHPDDEALLTSGSLARAAAEGHRVVLVVATAGEAGLAATTARAGGLGELRMAELRRSAAALGCARVALLGYDDSGMADMASSAANRFAAADVEEAALRLAAILAEESADVLTIYDPAGGYGHPDHVQVHRVGVRAAELAGTRVVLEATVDRTLLRRAARILRWCRTLVPGLDVPPFTDAYTARCDLTHRIAVRDYAVQKRAAMAAHASQASADGGDRTLAFFLRLPRPLFRLAFGHEWYVERGRRPGERPLDDMFATLTEAAR